MILAIDPGNIQSAYCLIDEDQGLKPVKFGKVENDMLLTSIITDPAFFGADHVAIEMIGHYGSGMPAGKSVFDTCIWIGRFHQALLKNMFEQNIHYIMRKDEKINLCGNMKAKDGNIIQALVDRFAPGVLNNGKGSKKVPGWFYGFAADVWQATAIGVTCYDLYLKGREAPGCADSQTQP